MKVMVCVDGSTNADVAFSTALALLGNKEEDELIFVTVAQDLQDLDNTFTDLFRLDEQLRIRREYKTMLRKYKKRARDAGARNVHAVLGVSSHAGEFIVRLAKSRDADLVVVGRRGLGVVSRFFAGSTSKYVMEYAGCNVLVAKPDSSPAKPVTESHLDSPLITPATPIATSATATTAVQLTGSKSAWEEVHKEQQRAQDYVGQVSSKNVVDLTKEQEEEERQRRIKEEQDMMRKEDEDRTAAHIGAVIDEENERKRRVKEDGLRVQRTFHVQIYDIDN